MKTSASRGRRGADSRPATLAAAVLAALRGGGDVVSPCGRRRPSGSPTCGANQKDVVKRFTFAQLRYPGGDWDPHPSGPAPNSSGR